MHVICRGGYIPEDTRLRGDSPRVAALYAAVVGERESGAEDRSLLLYIIYIYTHTHTHIHIYII